MPVINLLSDEEGDPVVGQTSATIFDGGGDGNAITIVWEDGIVSGSGQYFDFLRIHHHGNSTVESGFNHDVEGNPMDVTSSRTRELPRNSLETDADGNYIIRLDINETNAPVTLLDLRFYVSNTDPATGELTDLAGLDPFWSLPAGTTILLDDHSPGSGNDDYVIKIPAASVPPGANLIVYASFSNVDGGFEEFRALVNEESLLPAMDITKTASVEGGTVDAAGDVINYAIQVANTGSVALTGVVVNDPYIDAGSLIRLADVLGNNDNILDVGETWAFSATHTVTQAEMDSNGGGDGMLENTATADSNETEEVEDDADVPITLNPAIQIVKWVSVDGGVTWHDANSPTGPFAYAGADVQFKFVVTNTGNVTLSDVQVNDSDFDLNGAALGTSWVIGSLGPNGSHEFIFGDDEPYDRAVGQHTNTATASGNHLATPVSDTDDANYFGANPAIQVVKWVSVDGGVTWHDANSPTGPMALDGADIQFKFVVTNTGNVALSNVQVTDSDFDLNGIALGNAWVIGNLAAGGTQEFIFGDNETYNWVAGQHTNTATASGSHTTVNVSDTDNANYFGANPAIQIIKTGVVPDGAADEAGEAINYTFAVTNIGNVNLTSVGVTDPMIANIAYANGDDGDGIFEVGETWNFTGSYLLEQTVLDDNGNEVPCSGLLSNTAQASANFGSLTVTDEDDFDIDLVILPHLTLDKSVVTLLNPDDTVDADGKIDEVGEQVQYSFTLTNDGNAALENITLDDPLIALLDFDEASDVGGDGILSVGETWTWSGELVITQAHLDAAMAAGAQLVLNTATAEGETGCGDTASDTDTATVDIFVPGPGVRTPGFWASKNGQSFWDDKAGVNKSGPSFATGDLNDYNGDGVIQASEKFLYLGDWDGNGAIDNGEVGLKISLNDALSLLTANDKDSSDGQVKLGRDMIAAWLNHLAGNAVSDANAATYDPDQIMQDAIDWLIVNADANYDGILTMAELKASPVRTNNILWNEDPAGEELSAAQMHTVLDEYNNHGTITLLGVTTTYANDGDSM